MARTVVFVVGTLPFALENDLVRCLRLDRDGAARWLDGHGDAASLPHQFRALLLKAAPLQLLGEQGCHVLSRQDLQQLKLAADPIRGAQRPPQTLPDTNSIGSAHGIILPAFFILCEHPTARASGVYMALGKLGDP